MKRLFGASRKGFSVFFEESTSREALPKVSYFQYLANWLQQAMKRLTVFKPT